MKVVFFGSPPFATPILRGLSEGEFRPVAVVTQPARRSGRGRSKASSDVAELARAHDLPLLQPESLRDPEVLDRLRGFEADVFLVASYGELMREEFLAIPTECCLNVHPSLLPRHRGATPVPATILAGDAVTGVSIQRMVLELDAGDVLVASETPIAPGETAGELLERLAGDSVELCERALRAIRDGDARFTPQDAAAATHCRRLKKEDGRVDWSRPAAEVERLVRAMNPWPAARTALPAGGDLQILRAVVVDGLATPGALVDSDGRLVVGCGDGALELVEVKPPGKKAMDGAAYLRGARLEPETVLGASA